MPDAYVLTDPTQGEQVYRIEASENEWIQANADGVMEAQQ